MNHYFAKFSKYSADSLKYALDDCYEALRVGAGVQGPAYVAKLWAEIDAIYAVQVARRVIPIARA